MLRHRRVGLLCAAALVASAAGVSALPSPPKVATRARQRAVEALQQQLVRPGMPLGDLAAPAGAEAHAAPAADATDRVTMTPGQSIPMPQGYIAALPMSGLGDGVVAHIHSFGEVGVTRLDGTALWRRSDVSFVREISTLRAYLVPFIAMGRDPVYPTTPLGEHPFAVADLTGDGADDIAVAHLVARLGAPTRTTVDVLDGRDGHTVWSGLYSGRVVELAVVGNTLVVAQETGEPTQIAGGEAGAKSTLHGIRFTVTPGEEPGPGAGHGQGNQHSGGQGKGGKPGTPATFDVTPVWTYSTGVGLARWLSLTALDGAVAAAWSATPLGTADGDHGTVLVVDAATGALAWSAPTAAYPRLLRWDATRREVVLVSQTDPFATEGLSYDLTAYAVATGTPRTTKHVADAIPLALEVADPAGDAKAEWLVSDVELAPGVGSCPDPDVCASTAGMQLGNRVTSLSAGDGEALWKKSYPAAGGELAAHPMAYDLAVSTAGTRRIVLASSFTPEERNHQLDAYDGADGAELWSKRGANLAFPLYLEPATVGGRAAVLTATGRAGLYGASAALSVAGLHVDPVQAVEPYNVITARAVDDGATVGRAALLGDIRSAVALDAGGDATRDLVVGTDSGAVLALDGSKLGEDPGVLWRTVLPTQVHELKSADVDADGTREVVVTAAHSIAVLDGRTGVVRWSTARPDTFQWTTTVADLDGDGDDDLVVPAADLSGLDGRTGSVLWSYAPTGVDHYAFGTPAVAEGVVAVQYIAGVGAYVSTPTGVGMTPKSRSENDVLLDARTGAVRWTHSQPGQDAVPTLWRSTVLARGVAGVSGLAAAFTWDASGADGLVHPTVDVYDAATGTKAVTATNTQGASTSGTVASGGYVQVLSMSSSLGVGPDGGAVNNLKDMLSMSAAPVVVAGKEYLTVGVTGGGLRLVTPGSLATSRATVAGSVLVPTTDGGFEIGDVDGDGQDELIALPFNWDAYGTAQLPGGRFSFALSVQPRSLTVVRLAPAA